MMPALLMRTLRSGWSAISRAATVSMLVGIGDIELDRLHAGVGRDHLVEMARRRPEMITLLPSLWNASASPRPMPEPPPVMKMVLPVEFHESSPWLR